MKRHFIRTAVALVLLSGPAGATKPCPPEPCRTPSGSLDPRKCGERAAWVAVGEIADVVHHEQGPPLLKDFAEFTFRVSAWEKRASSQPSELRFRVGWCDNPRELPKDHSGRFRFYGLPFPSDPSLPNTYIDFQRLDSLPK
jgi:hypothetical protein